MASYYKKLKTDLAGAAAAGIITAEQADKVWERSYAGRTFAAFKATHWISAAAGLFIAFGVILVAAHNWDKIGAMAKMGAFLLLFAGVAEAALRLEEKHTAVIPLEILWFFMPVLGIGLYAQIFNLSGDPVRPYLAWAALSAPLALLSKRPAVAYLCAVLLFAVLYWGTLGSGNMLSLAARYSEAAQPVWHWALALAVLAAGVFIYPGKKLGLPLGASAAWLFFMLASDTAIKVRSEALMLLAAMSLTVLWLVWGSREDEVNTGFSLKVWIAAVYAMTFFWHHRSYSEASFRTDSPYGAAITWMAFGGALITVLLRETRLLPGGRTESYISKTLLAASILCAFLLFGSVDAQTKLLAGIANFILIAYGAGSIVSGSENSDEKAINRGVLVITLTAVTRFVDLFGSLLVSGEAFILTGLAFAALAYFINRGRKALIGRINNAAPGTEAAQK